MLSQFRDQWTMSKKYKIGSVNSQTGPEGETARAHSDVQFVPTVMSSSCPQWCPVRTPAACSRIEGWRQNGHNRIFTEQDKKLIYFYF